MEYSKFKSLLRRVIVIPMLVTAVLAALLLWESFDLNRSLQWVDHTGQVLDQSARMLKLLVDVETAMRGYLATGDEALLQPYLEGTKRFDSEYRALYQLVDDSAPQKQRLEDVRAGYVAWMEHADEAIMLRRSGKADGAFYESLPGKRGMDSLREQIAKFQDVETRLRVQRIQAAHRRWTLMAASCIVLGLGFAIFLTLFTRYHIERLGTKLLQSEERWTAALKAEALQSAIFNSANFSCIATDAKGVIQIFNVGAERMLGYAADEVMNKITPADISDPKEVIARAEQLSVELGTKITPGFEALVFKASREIEDIYELTYIRKDGSRFPAVLSVTALHDAQNAIIGYLLIGTDNTARKLIEAEQKQLSQQLRYHESLVLQKEQLRALAERLQCVREEDRKRVARDLHDQIGQILTAIKMDLTWVARRLPASEGLVLARLTESIQLINDGVKAVRVICSGLRPGALDDLGLAAAIEWQASDFASRNGVRCEVSVPPVDLHMDGDRATAAFRIFQECLTNVIRHAEAKVVRVSLSQEEENILLIVEDDGVGFRESDLSNSFGSLGLLGMKERAQFCGGDVQISSSPGNGTTVTVRVPMDTPGAEREQPCTY
jgi:signal transduction histidine kinase